MSFFQKVAARFDFRVAFRAIPAIRVTDYTVSHLDKGLAYHEGFNRLPGRRLVWRVERTFLEGFARRAGPFDVVLDFAGGTGRIAGVLEPHCTTTLVLDVSEKMLAVARTHLKHARIVCADFREAGPFMRRGAADVVTAFRFFPNAEADLREQAMAFIAGALRRGGHLICNNHRNFWSAPYVCGRLLLLRRYTAGMTHAAMVQLAARHGLSLVGTHSVGVLPQGERAAVLPWGIVERIEKAVSARWGDRHRAGYDVIYQFRKD